MRVKNRNSKKQSLSESDTLFSLLRENGDREG